LITEEVILRSPKPKDDPAEALLRAVELANGKDKGLGEIVLNLVKYIDHANKRIAQLEKK
jgi:hypothetical protein